jgi:hypothetical protein
MINVISPKNLSDPLLPSSISGLQGRIVTRSPVLESVWEKISRIIYEFISWVKSFFIPVSPPLKLSRPVETFSPPPALPLDTSFLRKDDPTYNLSRLAAMTPANAVQSVATEEIVKTLPKKSAIRMGYEDLAEHQTALGDKVVLIQTALTGAAIFGLWSWLRSSCLANSDPTNPKRFGICTREAADFWQNTSGKTLLACAALLLTISLYAHKKGWLGALLAGRSSGWRTSRLEVLFQKAANELTLPSKKDAAQKEALARQILINLPLIDATLQVEFEIPHQSSTKLTNLLKTACQEALDPERNGS